MANGFGAGAIFSVSNVTTTLVSGTVTQFSLVKQTEMKEVVDGNDNFLATYFPKKKKIANCTIVFLTSGSATDLPEVGSTNTFTVPWSADVTGSWGVTKSQVKSTADDVVTGEFELQQWYTSTGQYP